MAIVRYVLAKMNARLNACIAADGHPLAPPGGTVDDTIRRFGEEVLPRAQNALRLG